MSDGESRPHAERLIARVPRVRINPPDDLFPTQPWGMTATRYVHEFLAQAETIYALANGYLGLRGDFEEGTPVSKPGVFLNGFYETWPIVYGEAAYGFAKTGQTIVNATDGKIIRLYVDDEPLEIHKASLLEFRRTLDWRTGTVDRRIVWETPAGKRVAISSRRMVSMTHRHLALLTYDVRCLNHTAHIILSSEMMTRHLDGEGEQPDPRRLAGFDGRVLDPVARRSRDRRVLLCHRTRSSGITLACGMDHQLVTGGRCRESVHCGENRAEVVFSVDVDPEQPVHLTKFLAYHFAEDCDVEELSNRAERTLDRAMEIGETRLLEEQREALRRLLEAGGCRDRGRPAGAAGGAFQPVSGTPGDGARRGPWRARQGAHRPGIRRTLFLGRGDLRFALCDLHRPPARRESAAIPLVPARPGSRPRARTRPCRSALPMANHQRR